MTLSKDLSEIRALPYVTYANIYQPHFVIESRLKGVPAASSATAPLLPAPARTGSPVTVDVEFHKDVSETPELIKSLAEAARLDPDELKTDGYKARITVQRRYLADVAELDPVKSINQVHPVKLHNNVARGILGLAGAVVPGTANTPYEGEGQLVGVADTGFDQGSRTPGRMHAAFTTNGAARVRALYALGRPNNASDPDGHGTHVCGSVLGDGTYRSTGERIQGTAPKATLVMQSVLDRRGSLGGIPSDLRTLFAPPYDEHDVRIHTNSWGAAPDPFYQIEYNDSSKAIDDFVDTHRGMVILFAAGNDGMDTAPRDGIVDRSQVGAEAAAKNCISVGASESFRPDIDLRYSSFGFPKEPLLSDEVANNPQGMVAFSSRGPTREGRIKPDVVAPGSCILSTRSSRAPLDTDWGSSDGDGDPTYMYLGGTSMACPLVAGCCAVLRETLVRHGVASPSAALVKALLINGAVELPGQYVPSEAGASPNNSSGWGRVHVANSIVIGSATPESKGVVMTDDKSAGFRDEAEPLDTTDVFEFAIPIPAAGHTLKVTLVWTDPAGAALQNDLDLAVVAPGGQIERHGNQGANEFSVGARRPFDRNNNVEQIVWGGIPKGDAEVRVKAQNVTSLEGQTFALAWKVF